MKLSEIFTDLIDAGFSGCATDIGSAGRILTILEKNCIMDALEQYCSDVAGGGGGDTLKAIERGAKELDIIEKYHADELIFRCNQFVRDLSVYGGTAYKCWDIFSGGEWAKASSTESVLSAIQARQRPRDGLDDLIPQKASRNKYSREIKPSVFVDVYDTLRAFDVKCPAMQHAAKKVLCAGLRGHKDALKDKREAIQSIHRSIELDAEWKKPTLTGRNSAGS